MLPHTHYPIFGLSVAHFQIKPLKIEGGLGFTGDKFLGIGCLPDPAEANRMGTMNHPRQPMNLRISKGAARNLLGLLILALAVWMIPALFRKWKARGAVGAPLTMLARDPAVVDWVVPDGLWNRPDQNPNTEVMAPPVFHLQRTESENREASRNAGQERQVMETSAVNSKQMWRVRTMPPTPAMTPPPIWHGACKRKGLVPGRGCQSWATRWVSLLKPFGQICAERRGV